MTWYIEKERAREREREIAIKRKHIKINHYNITKIKVDFDLLYCLFKVCDRKIEEKNKTAN